MILNSLILCIFPVPVNKFIIYIPLLLISAASTPPLIGGCSIGYFDFNESTLSTKSYEIYSLIFGY